MADVESAVAATPGAGISIATVTRGSKEIQLVVSAGVGGTILATAVTVGTSVTVLPATALVNRKALYVHNNGTATIFIGGSGVTTSTGAPLYPGDGQPFDFAAGALVYAISGTAGQNVRVLEAS